MKLEPKSIITVLLIILSLVGLLGSLYMVFMVNGLVVGKIANVAANVSGGDNATTTFMTTMKSDFFTNSYALQSNISLAFSILAIVIILVLFGLGGYFAYDKFGKGKNGGL